MMSKPNFALLSALLLMFGIVGGCGHKNPPETPQVTVAPAPVPPTESSTVPPSSVPAVSNTPIQDAVKKLLAEQDLADYPFIPKGTKLLSVDFKDGVATLDFSREFSALADRGDTVESKAQKALRHTLADIHGVEKMRVTVEGKPFESQATDWNTPFPVREAEGDTDNREISVSDRGGGRQ